MDCVECPNGWMSPNLPEVSSPVPVLLNPVSGTLPAAVRRRRIVEAAEALGRSVHVVDAAGRAELGAQVRGILAEFPTDRLIVCGGDGTVGGVLAALAGSAVTVGIVPGGTGNQLARNLGIPLDTQSAVRVALTGTVVPIDMAVTDRGEWLSQMGGLGLDARMVAEVDARHKGRWGVAAYVFAALRHLGRHRYRARIRIDGKRPVRRKAATILVVNAGRLLGVLEPVPGASPVDGALHVGVFKTHTPGQWMRLAAALALQRVEEGPLVEIHRARRIEIDTKEPQPFEIDGEPMETRSHVTFTVVPGAVRVVVPSESVWVSHASDAHRDPVPTDLGAPGP